MEEGNMIDKIHEFEIRGKKYPIAFNLNVIEAIQEKYKGLEEWEKALGSEKDGEAISTLKWTLWMFVNAGIETNNFEKGEERATITIEQAGMLVGGTSDMRKIMETIQKVVTDSSPTESGEEKN